jgi:hypothetical protein
MPKQNPSASNGGGGPVSGKTGYDIGGRNAGASNLTNAIQNRSVKVIPAQSAEAQRAANSTEDARVMTAKTGAAARYEAGKAEAKYKAESPYLENQVVTVKSGNAQPYKITGGAGSTARRPGEIIEKPKGTQADHHVTDSSNHTRTVK